MERTAGQAGIFPSPGLVGSSAAPRLAIVVWTGGRVATTDVVVVGGTVDEVVDRGTRRTVVGGRAVVWGMGVAGGAVGCGASVVGGSGGRVVGTWATATPVQEAATTPTTSRAWRRVCTGSCCQPES